MKTTFNEPRINQVSGYDLYSLVPAYLTNPKKKFVTGAQHPEFPPYINGYAFDREIEKIGTTYSYRLGVYKNNLGDEMFAKLRSNRSKDYHYLSLHNEIALYRLLSTVRKRVEHCIPTKFSRIRIPEFKCSYEDENVLVMLMEYCPGTPIMNLPDAQKIEVYMNTAEYLQYLGDNLTQDEKRGVSVRTPSLMMQLFAITSIKSTLNFPVLLQYMPHILRFVLTAYPSVRKSRVEKLVHRDLHFRNIQIYKHDVVLIDLQQCVFTDMLQEYVTTLRYYWNTDEDYKSLYNRIYQDLKKHDQFVNRMRWLSIHSAIHGLTDGTFEKHITDKWIEFLEFALNERSFKKGITV